MNSLWLHQMVTFSLEIRVGNPLNYKIIGHCTHELLK